MKPNSGLNVQTYGLQFIDYLPYYQRGICRLKERGLRPGPRTTSRRRRSGAPSRSPRRTSRRCSACARTPRARTSAGDARRCRRRPAAAAGGGGARAEEELRRGARPGSPRPRSRREGLDPGTLRQVTEARDRIRATQAEIQDAAARAQRIDQRLAESSRLLDEGKATEAVVGFDDVLKLDPHNARALEGKKTAQERILAATTPAEPGGELPQRARPSSRPGSTSRRWLPSPTPPPTPRTGRPATCSEKARQVVEGMRKQKESQAAIETLLAQGERLLLAGQFPEAQVTFESVLRLDKDHAAGQGAARPGREDERARPCSRSGSRTRSRA